LLAEITGNSGDAEESIRCLSFVAELEPQNIAAHVNLASALVGVGKFAGAVAAARRALSVDPQCIHAYCNLSVALLRMGELQQAEESARRALHIDASFLPAHTQLGDVLLARGDAREAARSYGEAARLAPSSPIACNNLGYAQQVAGDLDQALRCYDQAIALDPGYVQAHVNRAAIFLLREEFAKGWDEYEWRLREPSNVVPLQRHAAARWDGEPLAGKSILVHAEQGLGDQIMYASCLSEVASQARECVARCEPRLVSLLQRSLPGLTVLGEPPARRFDFAIEMGSLPRFLRRHAGAFPGQRYLAPDAARVARWRARLAQLGHGPKIGLSWRGGVPQTGRAWRSLTLEQLQPVLGFQPACFVSLQYGDAGGEIEAFKRSHGVTVHHWPEAIEDCEETAALVCALDLTVSVCTAIVHLCGALGRPVWVMTPVAPESRYGFTGPGMRWYASARMFRQARHAEWGDVIRDIVRALPTHPC
jgi:Flp pilus assembly protein TadD